MLIATSGFKKNFLPIIIIVALISILLPISLKTFNIYSVYGGNQVEEVINWTIVDTEYSASDTTFNDIDFLNKTHGWIVGKNNTGVSGGIVLHTSNSGIDWNLQYYNVSHEFTKIEIVNETAIWINGIGSLFFTADMGDTWIERPIVNRRSGLAFVGFLNETHGWTATSKSLFKTINGGKSWINDSSWTFLDTPRDLEFVDSETGYLIGFRGIYRTTDTGLTWLQQVSNSSVRGISMIDPTQGWIVGSNSLFKMEDGKTWKSLPIPRGSSEYTPFGSKSPYFYDVEFLNATHGWISGVNPPMITTRNGGQTWYSQKVPEIAQNGLKAIYFINVTHGWAVGEHGAIIYTTTGGGVGGKLVPLEKLVFDVLIFLITIIGFGGGLGYLFFKYIRVRIQ